MITSKKTPEWAKELVLTVCADYKRKLPKKLLWSNKTRPETSGYTLYNGGYISVVAGTEEWQHRTVLLHELAHHIICKTRKGQQANHNRKFWELVVTLNESYGDIELMKKREVELPTNWRPGTRVTAARVFADRFN